MMPDLQLLPGAEGLDPDRQRSPDRDRESRLFHRIAIRLQHQGFAVIPRGLPAALSRALANQVLATADDEFVGAGVGRGSNRRSHEHIRRSQMRWINGQSPPEQLWLDWADRLRVHLNRSLYLGLGRFESQFSHYRPGDFYRTHVDAFQGRANRQLSLVTYLNRDWQSGDGGQLLLYAPESGVELRSSALAPLRLLESVTPAFGTLVLFFSDAFPHEVLPTQRHRYGIAGWFRRGSDLPT